MHQIKTSSTRRGKATGVLAVLAVAMLVVAAGCTSDSSDGGSSKGDATTTTAAGGASTTLPATKGLDEAKIGVILPLSGPLAVPAAEIKTGMETEVEVWNDAGDGPKLSLEFCDDGNTPERSLSCIDRLTEAGVDIYTGPHFGTTWPATIDAYTEKGVFVITGNPAAQPEAGTSIFSSGTPTKVALELVFGEFADRGYKKVGFLSTTDGTGAAAAKQTDAIAEEHDLSLTKAEFAPTDQSATPQAQQLVAASPDAIMVWTSGLASVTALRGLQAAGYDGPVVLNYSNAGPSIYALAKDVLPKDVAMVGTASMLGEVDDEVRSERIAEFEKRFVAKNPAGISFNALSAADIVIVAAEAASHGSTPAEMTAYLESGAKVPGLAVQFEYSADSHIGSNDPGQLRLVKLVDGAWVAAD